MIVVKKFDLEDRTLQFAIRVRNLVSKLPKSISNYEYVKQIIRSSSSIGANYIEANEGLGSKDFIYKLKISRKEAKETSFWLKLIHIEEDSHMQERDYLINETGEFIRILSAIISRRVSV
jgi:four helix bundle protein